jgi:protein-disulfide isomerase
MSTRAAAKERARAGRKQAERERREAERRRQRLFQLGAVVLAAALIVAVLIGVSQSGSDDGGNVEGGADAGALFAGIPQNGNALGDPGARGTLTEFADLQCPYCAQYAAEVLPEIVREHVRGGGVRLALLPIAIIGPDSERGALATIAAGRQDRMWQFAHVFYASQGAENSGYVDDGFIRRVAAAVPGLDVDRLMRDMQRPAVAAELRRNQARAQLLGVSGTPTFFVARGDGAPEPLPVQSLSAEAFAEPLARLSSGG